jgi:hypothetical protein
MQPRRKAASAWMILNFTVLASACQRFCGAASSLFKADHLKNHRQKWHCHQALLFCARLWFRANGIA